MNIGVIFAGGVGTRMHSKERPKQFLEIYNKPIIIYTLEHFEKCDDIDGIVISCVKEWIPYLEKLIYKYRIEKVKSIVLGGETGQLSIYNGLCAVKQIFPDDNCIVLIHDGVRPLISSSLLTNAVSCVKQYGSAITTSVVKETIIVVSKSGLMEEVPTRDKSRIAKAPQCFYLKDILKAHENALKENIVNFIDSCTMMNHYGYKLQILDGPFENIKITTADDFYTMRAILEAKENAQIYGFDT